ncbi:MAG TPA: hypothetical protein DCX07_01005 [Phycisphaerales bacterium]|nr:hypothetical protein [Phycisphaerales bacterium]
MARGHQGLPRPEPTVISKRQLLDLLREIDSDRKATRRILAMETEFRRRIAIHVQSLPAKDADFSAFCTNPFVLLIHSLQHGYSRIQEIERDILPAKQFSSMETSAGKMVEAVALPVYGWEIVESGMHTSDSALDGRCMTGDTLQVATLKSGPRCLNDEMSENFADAVVNHGAEWASKARVRKVDFSYGVLYGTKKQSNKKDWHILRNICEKVPAGSILVRSDNRWDCAFRKKGIVVTVAVRVGLDWWSYLGGPTCFVELCTAMIRACIKPTDSSGAVPGRYAISDLLGIVSVGCVPDDFNVSVLQRSQLEWLFFVARHFCDEITD